MVGIIVVFPNKDNATNIRNLLVRAGLNVTGVCTTGAQAMNYADSVDEGIIVCGYKLKDMMYSELREYLPDRFEMLLIASQGKWEEGLASGVMGLTMPIKAYDLMNTLQMMLQNMDRRRRKRKKTIKSRTPEQEALIRKAKELLITTDIQVSNIGYDVGFTSPSYFTKCFREKYGMTPNEYRAKQTRQNVTTQNEQ